MDTPRASGRQGSPQHRLPITHPAAITAVAVLLINDHVLKALAPGTLTGKVSDVAGLIFFPVLVVSVVMLARRDEWTAGAGDRLIGGAVVVTAIGFTASKTLPFATSAWNTMAGLLQWPLSATMALLTGARLPALRPGGLVMDPTDLLALPALGIALWIDRRVRIEPAKLGRPGRVRHLRGAATLVVASLAVAGTSLDPPTTSLSSDDHLTVHLTQEASAVLLAMNLEVTRGTPPEEVTTHIHAQASASMTERRPSGDVPTPVQLTVVALDDGSDPPADTRRVRSGVSMDAPSAPCAHAVEPCELRYLVAVSIPPDHIPADGVDIEIEGRGTLSFDFTSAPDGLEEANPEDAAIAITLSDDPAITGWHLGPVASVSGNVRLDRNSDDATVGFAMRAPAELVEAAADGSMSVARLFVDFEREADPLPLVRLSGDAVGNDSERHLQRVAALHLMPFDSCPGGSDCDRELLATFALGGADGREAGESTLLVEWWLDVLVFLPVGTGAVGEVAVEDLCARSPHQCISASE